MLNLARKLADGELVTVGVPAADSGGPAAGGGAPPAGLPPAARTAYRPEHGNASELDTLPGVGPVLAQRILDWRTEHGRFATVDQLPTFQASASHGCPSSATWCGFEMAQPTTAEAAPTDVRLALGGSPPG